MLSTTGNIGLSKTDFRNYFTQLNNEKLIDFGKMVLSESSISVEKMYDKIALTYDETFSKRNHIHESFKLIDPDFKGQLGIDLGCGTGRSTEPVLQYCDEVVGISQI